MVSTKRMLPVAFVVAENLSTSLNGEEIFSFASVAVVVAVVDDVDVAADGDANANADADVNASANVDAVVEVRAVEAEDCIPGTRRSLLIRFRRNHHTWRTAFVAAAGAKAVAAIAAVAARSRPHLC